MAKAYAILVNFADNMRYLRRMAMAKVEKIRRIADNIAFRDPVLLASINGQRIMVWELDYCAPARMLNNGLPNLTSVASARF